MKNLNYIILFLALLGCGNSHEPNIPNDLGANTPSNNAPITENKNEESNNSSYQKVSFKTLNGFKLLKKMQPSLLDLNAVIETEQEKIDQINSQVPEEIKKLNGINIEASGYAFPLKFANGKTTEFILMCVIPNCCFGDALRPNDIIYVTALKSNLKVKENQFLKVKGKLTIEAKLDADRSYPFLYWITADEVELSKPGL